MKSILSQCLLGILCLFLFACNQNTRPKETAYQPYWYENPGETVSLGISVLIDHAAPDQMEMVKRSAEVRAQAELAKAKQSYVSSQSLSTTQVDRSGKVTQQYEQQDVIATGLALSLEQAYIKDEFYDRDKQLYYIWYVID